MRVARVLFLLAITVGVTSVVTAQIPTRRPSQGVTTSAPRLLVANPHSFNVQDSLAAVTIGDGMRTRMDKVVGDHFRVLTRVEMNDALKQYGYPADAILAPLPERSLSQSLNARVMVSSTLTKDPNGRYTVSARLAGLNDDAGSVVTMTQGSGQTLSDLGAKVADRFEPAFKAWDDAKACVNETQSAPDKAQSAGKKAVQQMRSNGLANFCLGKLSLAKGTRGDSAEAMKYFQEAVSGDPLSLAAWTQLAAGYEVQGDTAKTIDALKQMVRIAPTNQPLRELAFKKFLAYGHPEIAEQIAEEGLKFDPSNPDLLDLLANARIFREDYSGALDALEQIVALDSTRADSTFYIKYLVTASQKPDSARLITWASRAARKFPGNLTIMRQVAAAYAQVGQSDSLIAVLNLLVSQDTTATVGLALQQAKTLQDAKDPRAGEFLDFAARYGDAQAKEAAAGLLLNATLPYLQPPDQNFDAAVQGLQRVISLADPNGRYAPIANHFLGLALVNIIAQKDKEAEAGKSCDIAKNVTTLTSQAEAAFAQAGAYAAQQDARNQMLKYLTGLKPRTASMIKVYCK